MKNYLLPANILLPKTDFEKWSVIACDQYTSEPEYWQQVKETVGDTASAFNIVLPEVYLSADNCERIKNINNTMQNYINDNIFNSFENTLIYTVRTQNDGKCRHGIVGLIDLEDYSYEKGANTPIRATEATVLDRIPPRVEIRKDALLELPHVMLLINDPLDTVIKPVSECKENLNKLYDFKLMQNGGAIKGYALDEKLKNSVDTALRNLIKDSEDGLLFAVGDGNHSLATAKECYNKGYGDRYALVEIVNIHDSSLEFEPIYRALFNVNPETVIKDFVDWCGGEYLEKDAQKFTCVYGNKECEISVKPKGTLCVATLQTFLDEYLKDKANTELDYIHGIASLKNICKKENTLGFIFDGMQKSELFKAVACDGSLPRKTFSMGTADDKRFYLEARKIK